MKPMILNTETTQRVELIDKNKALELLKKNTQNFRKLDKRKVFKYAREMKEGRWQFNGEAIQFYKNGVLANGQHRLWAVVYADVSIPFLIVEGIDNSVTTIDVGSKRTISQLARANGYTMSTQKSSAISLILHGYSEKAEDKQTGETEILDFYELISDDIDAIERVSMKGNKNSVLRRGACIAAAYCLLKSGKITIDKFEQFAIICNSGLTLDGVANNAPLALKKTFENMNQSVKKYGMSVFDVSYRSMVDFVNGNSPLRAYRIKMSADEINKILADTKAAVLKEARVKNDG